jgi:hypothetical protein
MSMQSRTLPRLLNAPETAEKSAGANHIGAHRQRADLERNRRHYLLLAAVAAE